METSDATLRVPAGRTGRRDLVLRAALGLFVLLSCLRAWIGPFPILPEARAQIPDAGLQRKLMLEETQRTNQLLAEIKRLLESGELNVRIKGADSESDK